MIRPDQGRCDLGAYEFDDGKPPVTTVTNTNNSGDGSLRDAIESVEPHGKVVFAESVSGAITLNTQITLGEPVTIEGPGAQTVTVSGGDSTRIFRVDANEDVTISGLTLANGRHQEQFLGAFGGAVLMTGGGTLTLTETRVVDNTVQAGHVGQGAGIYANGLGNLVLKSVTLAGNTATGQAGAAGGGVAMSSAAGTVSMTNVTISGNESSGEGGGLWIDDDVDAVLTNTTVANNTAGNAGGGIHSEGHVELVNSLVGDNTMGGSFVPSDCAKAGDGTFTGTGRNLIESNACEVSGDVISGQDPKLGPLALDLGTTETHALLLGSPAINRAPVSPAAGACPPPDVDQRGVERPNGLACDLGAYEAIQETKVTNTDDVGDGSLRNALDRVIPGGKVVFADNVSGTIALENPLVIDKPVAIEGPGAQKLALSGNDATRIIDVDTDGDVEISGLTLRDGRDAPADGEVRAGAVYKAKTGKLTIRDAVLTGNLAEFLPTNTSSQVAVTGGAMTVVGGDLALERVEVSENVAKSSSKAVLGGGVYAGPGAGSVTMTNVTVSGNMAGTSGGQRHGGGMAFLDTDGPITLSNVTAVGNAAIWGGGIETSEEVNLVNSIIADNTGQAADCLTHGDGKLILSGTNIVRDITNCVRSGEVITGQDPVLGPLAFNRPGDESRTHATLDGSPALDAASGSCPGDDQRKVARPQGPACDLGAYERLQAEVANVNDNGAGSLREAIDAVSPGGLVTFADAVGGRIELESTLQLDEPVSIVGPGARTLAVSGQDAVRVFDVTADGDMTISGLTITEGHASTGSGGGGIRTDAAAARLTLREVQITDNAAEFQAGVPFGGGVLALGGSLTIEDATVSGNTATGPDGGIGGGVSATQSEMTMKNVTVSGNEAANAGGIDLNSDVDGAFENVTVAANAAADENGGLRVTSAAHATLANSLVAGNSAQASPDCGGTISPVTFVGKGVNLVGDPSGCEPSGGVVLDGDPLLDVQLRDNGGPTKTLALLGGSPAIDAATDPLGDAPCVAADQRGVARPQGDACDLGAFESRRMVSVTKDLVPANDPGRFNLRVDGKLEASGVG
jgi:predicted outer membrane repeat protein